MQSSMALISPDFKPYVEKWFSGIQEITEPMKGLGTGRADSRLVGDQIREITRIARYGCPMHSSISKIAPIVDKLFVNGTEVPL